MNLHKCIYRLHCYIDVLFSICFVNIVYITSFIVYTHEEIPSMTEQKHLYVYIPKTFKALIFELCIHVFLQPEFIYAELLLCGAIYSSEILVTESCCSASSEVIIFNQYFIIIFNIYWNL